MTTKAPGRVRISPSPTGAPHLGTLYVGLYNYLFAKHHGGQVVLRFDDVTPAIPPGSALGDVPGNDARQHEAAICAYLAWLGVEWNEGPDRGGAYGPYRQSERMEIYRTFAAQLVGLGGAYPCFCKVADIARRNELAQRPSFLGYDRHCAALDPAVAAARVAEGERHAIRLRTAHQGLPAFIDLVRGPVGVLEGILEDSVLINPQGLPTLRFSTVVDDHLMKISHVIRADEWIIQTPQLLAIYWAFGWTPPEFGHLPIIRLRSGRKLSRKDGDLALAEYHQARMTPRELRRMLVPAYRLVNPATAGEMDNKFDPFAQGWAEQTVYVAQPVAQRQ